MQPQRPPELGPPEVLVVEDEPSIRYAVADVLTLEGYAVRTAANGCEALDEVQRELPRVIVLDMRMPVMDGWTFVHELEGRGFHVPILVLTAAHNAELWAGEVGASRYLPKPFDLIDLIDAVDDLLED